MLCSTSLCITLLNALGSMKNGIVVAVKVPAATPTADMEKNARNSGYKDVFCTLRTAAMLWLTVLQVRPNYCWVIYARVYLCALMVSSSHNLMNDHLSWCKAPTASTNLAFTAIHFSPVSRRIVKAVLIWSKFSVQQRILPHFLYCNVKRS